MTATPPIFVTQQQVEDAFSSLNLYVGVVAHNEACFTRLNARLVQDLEQPIANNQPRARAEFPSMNLDAGKGETDYLRARRSDEPRPISRRAIRNELDQRIRQVEGLLTLRRAGTD